MIPKSVSYFEGSEYPLPIKTTIFGKDKLNLDNLNKVLIEKKGKDIKEILELLLIYAIFLISITFINFFLIFLNFLTLNYIFGLTVSELQNKFKI